MSLTQDVGALSRQALKTSMDGAGTISLPAQLLFKPFIRSHFPPSAVRHQFVAQLLDCCDVWFAGSIPPSTSPWTLPGVSLADCWKQEHAQKILSTHSSKPGQRPKSSQGCELTQKPRASRLQEPAAGKHHPEQKSQRNRKIFFLLPSTVGSVAGGWAESQGKGKAGLQCLSQLFPAKAPPPAPGKLLPSTDARAAGTGINRQDGNNLAAHELHTPRSLEREVESPL